MNPALKAGAVDPNLGRTLKSAYRIDKVLGAGGMGVVYRGEQIALRKAVAIKTLKPDAYAADENRERFEREAAMAARLSHPGVAQVFDYGIDAELPFLVMEFVEGASLADVIEREGPLSPARALSIARQLIAVLAEAHRLKLIHRDIKPDNLRLLRYSPDEPPVVKVLDFGIAKEMGTEQAKLTATGAILGTPLYISPEQAQGIPLDGRADQYSAGAVLYEMLAGRPPILGTSLANILVNQISKPPPPLPSTVPEPLARIVLRMLKKDPEERFSDDAALEKAFAEVERVCAKAKTAPRPDPKDLVPKPVVYRPLEPTTNRRPVLIAAAAGGLLLAMVLSLLAARKLQSKPQTPTGIPTAVTQPVAAPPPVLEKKAEPVAPPAEPVEGPVKKPKKQKGKKAFQVDVIH